MAKPTRQELLEHLRTQLGYMDASCAAFDSGHLTEAARLSVAARLICHHTGASTSLLHHLGAAGTIAMIDTVPAHFRPFGMPPGGFVVGGGLATIRLHQHEDGTVEGGWITRDEAEPARDVSLRQWWDAHVMFPLHGDKPTRRNVVLWLANKDGGAHIDALPPVYKNLKNGNAMGVGYQVNNVHVKLPSPFPHVMRQITEELRTSLRRHFANDL